MLKKKRLLSLLMGAISSLSIVGAKGQNKNSEIKTSNSISLKVCQGRKKRLEETTSGTNNVISTEKISLNEQLCQKMQDEYSESFGRIVNLGGLSENEIEYFLPKIASYLKAPDGTAQLLGAMYKSFVSGNLQKDNAKLLEAFVPICEKKLLEDLKKNVNNVSYGFENHRRKRGGCCVSLDNVKNRLGKSYWYDISDLRDLSDEEAESVFLKTVFSHLMISSLRKLESKSYEEKSTFDIMKQIILSRYVSKDDSFEKVSGQLIKGVDSLIANYNNGKKEKNRLHVSWLKEARSSVSKDQSGDGYSWRGRSVVAFKSGRYGFWGSRFEKQDKLNFILPF